MTAHVETKEIPAQTIETLVVSIPASEWRKMELQRTLLLFIPFMSLFAAIGGMVIVSKNVSTTSGPVPLVLFFGALATTFALIRSAEIAGSLRRKLLLKHGWDGKLNYEVELAYQTLLHD